MKTNVIKNIYSDILELSSLEKQKKYWLNNDPENASSYVEVMCRLFDDNDFDDGRDLKFVRITSANKKFIKTNK